MTLSLKSDVQLKALSPWIVLADMVVASIYAKYGLPCEITSGTEGQHTVTPPSKHGSGDAHDYKTFHVPPATLPQLVMDVAAALPGYDVLYEAPEKPAALPDRNYWKSTVPHLHVEFDPHTYTPGG